MEHFDGYLEPIEDDSALFRTFTEQVPSTLTVAPELLWYLGPHPKSEGWPCQPTTRNRALNSLFPWSVELNSLNGFWTWTVDRSVHRRSLRTSPCPSKRVTLNKRLCLLNLKKSLPFLDGMAEPDYMVRATDESRPASPALQALIDLSDVELAQEQEQNPNLRLVKYMIRDSPEWPSWEHVRAESADVKALWSQHGNLKIRDGALLRHRKNEGLSEECQIVAPQPIRTRIFQVCHHHKGAAHQGVVRTLALIKRRFYWPNMQKDI